MIPPTSLNIESFAQFSNPELFSFEQKITEAKVNGQEWVETTEAIISHFNPKGLCGREYFIYKGVKVCSMGRSEDINDKIEIPLYTLNKDNPGRIVGRS